MDTARLQQLTRRLAALADAAPFALHYSVAPIRPPGTAVLTAGRGSGQGTVPRGEGARDAVSRGADVVVPSFSTRKVSVLCAVLARVRAGELDLAQELTVTAALTDGVQAGLFKDLTPGIRLSLRDCLVQMMSTSDNVCTQLVFEALAPGDPEAALQYVNDYCAWAGLRATLHRETFPRTGDLTWAHPVDAVTTTTAADQAGLLYRVGVGALMTEAGPEDGEPGPGEELIPGLGLTPEDCRLVIRLLRGIHTPRLGAGTRRIRFAEKNGRGLRSLSQVGLAVDSHDRPLAALAVYAENIPTELPDGLPGRTAVFEAFAEVGLAVQDAVSPVVHA